ncbi:hypothetical protein CTAYLR_008286 [Chrysophaeum taylorii]|uniref:Ankyrin repeat domain-containing protein n=1 Tax=Chrysophaeum taylorii TaxID=2483200 RepID=A0AAD7U6F7_9STRA|nr:hypothetical protein CTAYLR_008286 [Chrysophaeum taylorii]
MAFMRCCIRGSGQGRGSREMRYDLVDATPRSSEKKSSSSKSKLSQEALFEASESGNREEVRRHVEDGFNVNVVDQEDGYTALLLASECGKLGVVEELVHAGAALDAKDSFGRTALYAAAVAGHADVVALLSHAGADANAADDDGRTPFWATCALRHLQVASFLLDVAGVPLDARDHSSKSPLAHAIESGHADVIDFLKQRGAKDSDDARLAA